MTERPPDFDRLGDLLKEACGPLMPAGGIETPTRSVGASTGGGEGAEDGRSLARLLALVWADAVGEEVAANARPVQLREGRLAVSTSSSAWAQTLQLMTDTIKRRLNERLGAQAVMVVVFRHAGWEETAHRSRMGATAGGSSVDHSAFGSRIGGKSHAPTTEEKVAIAEVKGLGLQPDLEESILRAMRASFGRMWRL